MHLMCHTPSYSNLYIINYSVTFFIQHLRLVNIRAGGKMRALPALSTVLLLLLVVLSESLAAPPPPPTRTELLARLRIRDRQRLLDEPSVHSTLFTIFVYLYSEFFSNYKQVLIWHTIGRNFPILCFNNDWG